MTGRRMLFGGALLLLISLYHTLPASAQGVGAIGGSVLDASGAVLPGAAVTLISPQGTVGGSQETVSDCSRRRINFCGWSRAPTASAHSCRASGPSNSGTSS